MPYELILSGMGVVFDVLDGGKSALVQGFSRDPF